MLLKTVLSNKTKRERYEVVEESIGLCGPQSISMPRTLLDWVDRFVSGIVPNPT